MQLPYPRTRRNARPCVSTTIGGIPNKQNYPKRKPKSISSFFAGFKSSVNSNIDDYIDNHKLDIPKFTG